jgi:hypothetical protein
MGITSIIVFAMVVAFSFYTMDMIYKMSQDMIYIRKTVTALASQQAANKN